MFNDTIQKLRTRYRGKANQLYLMALVLLLAVRVISHFDELMDHNSAIGATPGCQKAVHQIGRHDSSNQRRCPRYIRRVRNWGNPVHNHQR